MVGERNPGLGGEEAEKLSLMGEIRELLGQAYVIAMCHLNAALIANGYGGQDLGIVGGSSQNVQKNFSKVLLILRIHIF